MKMNEIQGNPIDMGLIKQEPIDVDFKSELIEGPNQFDFVENDPFSPSSPIWHKFRKLGHAQDPGYKARQTA